MASLIARLSSTLFFTIAEKIKVPIAVTIQPTVKIKKQIINFESNPWVVIQMNITVRRSRQSGVARATCPD